MVVRPTHRIIAHRPHGSFDWISALADTFALEDLGPLSPVKAEERVASAGPESLVLLPDGEDRAWLAVARPEALRSAGVSSERQRIAAVVFDELVLRTLYGLEADQASNEGLLSYSRSPASAAAVSGGGGCAFILPPVSLEDVWDVAYRGGRLPPKCTYFEPKMPSGLLFRPL